MNVVDKKSVNYVKEKGSVLLLTLIVMSSIMILWITYVYAIIEARKKVQMEVEAEEIERDSKATFTLAMAQLNKALITNQHSEAFVNIKNESANGWPSGRYFKIEGGSFLQGMSALYEARTYSTGFLATPSAMQQYELCQRGESIHLHNGFVLFQDGAHAPKSLIIQTKNTVTAADYMIIDESAKLNISSLIKEENSLIKLDSFGLTESIAKRMKEKMPDKAKWFSWKHIWNSGVFRSNEETARKATSFFTTNGWDLEAFQFFASEHDLKGTAVRRMNLNDSKLWQGESKLTPFEIAGLTETGDDLFTLAPVDYNGELRQDLKQVPNIKWSKQTRSLPAFSHIVNRRQRLQVACNLIDFCDEDHKATFGPGNSLSYETTFCGLEKSPYINHLVFQLDFQPITRSNGLYKLTDLKIEIGIANMYEKGHVVTIRLPDTNEIIINGQKVKGGLTSKKVICRAHALASLGAHSFIDCNNIPPSANFKLSIGKFRVELYSTDGRDLQDVSVNAKELPMGSVTPTQIESYKGAIYFRDCRCNTILSTHNPDGVINENVVIKSLSAAKFQPQFQTLLVQKESNPQNIHNNGGDLESVVSIVNHLSTAYVADGKIQSLWELGAIHRGFPWQTIHLSIGEGDSEYNKGDLDLLDQVTLSKSVKSTALKFNPTSATEPIWSTIIKSLKIKSQYGSPIIGKTIPGQEALVHTLTQHCLGRVFKGRSKAVVKITPSLNAENDREQEEIIGKIAKYMSVRKNIFRVVTTVLLLKEIPRKVFEHHHPSEVVTDYRDLNNIRYFKKISSRKRIYLIYRDAFENRYKILSSRPLTD